MSDRRARIALSLLCEPGDPRLVDVLAAMTPSEALAAIRSGGSIGGHRCPEAWRYSAADLDQRLEFTEKLAEAADLQWLTPADRGWPERLDDLNHAVDCPGSAGSPLGLWVRGDGRLDELVESSVAIVGARDCTAYGSHVAAEMAADIASAGVTVVSGAAYGIDASAHRGALSALSPTIAVLACDAATAYPRAHESMLNRIAAEGLVISEQPPGQIPTKSRFLSRNRLIAALTGGTVVVEARRRSGSLNTLGWADRLGRVTMAVPGPVTAPQCVGPHVAVREGRAILVTSGAEVVEEVAPLGAAPTPVAAEAAGASCTAWDQLSRDECQVMDALEWKRGVGLDDVARRARIGRKATRRALDALVSAGFVTLAGPSSWILVRRADLDRATVAPTVGE